MSGYQVDRRSLTFYMLNQQLYNINALLPKDQWLPDEPMIHEVKFDESASDVRLTKVSFGKQDEYVEDSSVNIYEENKHMGGNPMNFLFGANFWASNAGTAMWEDFDPVAIENAWKEHLRDLDDLKTEVQNASYEHKDPLLIYKLESFGLFDALLQRINREIVSFLTKGDIPELQQQQPQIKEAKLPESDAKKLQTGRNEVGSRQVSQGGKGSAPIRVEKRVGRNDPCPCGSGKKYKNLIRFFIKAYWSSSS